MRLQKWVSLSLIASLLMTSIASAAGHRSNLGQNAVEDLIQVYFNHLKAPDLADISEVDQETYAQGLADQLLLLSAAQFNDVWNHVAADFVQHTEHREAMAKLVAAFGLDSSPQAHPSAGAEAIRAVFYEEINRNRELSEHPTEKYVQMILDGALAVFAATFTFQLGYGMWKGTATQSKGMLRFKTILRMGRYTVAQGKNARAIGALVGADIGLVQAAVRAFETRRGDPRRVLEIAQEQVLQLNTDKASLLRDEMRTLLAEPQDQLRSYLTDYRKRITEMDDEVTSIQNDLRNLPLSRNNPLIADLIEVRNGVRTLAMVLDRMEVTQSF
ncbi:hypothetical protein WDW37_07550 [Bdellovibrionota bacterium FG-1]